MSRKKWLRQQSKPRLRDEQPNPLENVNNVRPGNSVKDIERQRLAYLAECQRKIEQKKAKKPQLTLQEEIAPAPEATVVSDPPEEIVLPEEIPCPLPEISPVEEDPQEAEPTEDAPNFDPPTEWAPEESPHLLEDNPFGFSEAVLEPAVEPIEPLLVEEAAQAEETPLKPKTKKRKKATKKKATKPKKTRRKSSKKEKKTPSDKEKAEDGSDSEEESALND